MALRALFELSSVDDLKTVIIDSGSTWLQHKVEAQVVDKECNSTIHRLHLESDKTIGARGVRLGIRLPIGVSENEWIAARTVLIWQEVLWVAAVLEDICTPESCPKMSAGQRISYAWQVPGSTHPPEKCCAPQYVQQCLDWVLPKLRDPKFIPHDGQPFPANFKGDMQQLHKRFFRIYAHTYMHHYQVFRDHEAEAHLNAIYKHWFFFTREFGLMREEDMLPLAHLNAKILARHADEDAVREHEAEQQRAKWEEVFGELPGDCYQEAHH